MIITCPSCATRYSLEDSKIPDDGRQVRCVQCDHIWHQDPAKPDDLLSLDEAGESASEPEVPQLEQPPAEDDAPPEEVSEETDEAEETAEPEETGEDADDDAADVEDAVPEPAEDDGAEDGPAEDEPSEDEALGDGDEPSIDAADEEGADEDGAPVSGDEEPRLTSSGSSAWRSVRERSAETEVVERSKKATLIGWGILAAVFVSVVAAVALLRPQLEDAWPPSQRLYMTFDNWFGEEKPEAKSAGTGTPVPSGPSDKVSIDVMSSRIDLVNGERVLLIEGRITNAGDTDAPVPNLRGTLLNETGETLYSWDFSVPFLIVDAGTQREFETRVVDPPAGARNMNLEPVTEN